MANIALLLGEKTEYIATGLRKRNDSFDFFIYPTIERLIKDSKAKQLYFDRILMSEQILKKKIEEDLTNLNDYISKESSSTKIILILKDANNPANAIFGEIFNAPTFVTVTLSSVSLSVLLNFLEDDMVQIKGIYHKDPDPVVEKPEEKKETKKGLLGKFGKNKEVETKENISKEVSVETVEKQEEPMKKSNIGSYANMSGMGINVQTESEEIPISQSVSEDDDLLLGGAGRTHTDTGYLDGSFDDDFGDQYADPDEEGDVEEEVEEFEYKDRNAVSELDDRLFNGVVLITGERGVGVTKFIVETALQLYDNGRGKKVLIVDCDYKRNGVLSFIEVEDFYAQECYNGIDKLKYYHDKEADIISNGYGVPVTKQQIHNLLNNGNVADIYDVVLLDCPTDCLNSISERAMRKQRVLVLANGDRGSLMATSIALTDKSIVEAQLQRYIMHTCIPCIGKYSEHYIEDVDFVKNIMFFPNGCWLDNLKIED